MAVVFGRSGRWKPAWLAAILGVTAACASRPPSASGPDSDRRASATLASGSREPAPEAPDEAGALRPVLDALALLDLRWDRAAGEIGGRWGGDVVALTVDLAPVAALPPPGAGSAVDAGSPTGVHDGMGATDAKGSPEAGAAAKASVAVRRAPGSGEGSSFRLRLPPKQTLLGGRALTVTLESAGGTRRVLRRRVPYVRVSLHPGDVVGAGLPLAPVTVTLRGSDGALRARGLARAEMQGDFMVWLRDANGARVRARPGDRVTVEAGDAPWSLDLPTLDGRAQGPSRLGGTGPPGADIDLTLWNPWLPGQYQVTATAAGPDGRWSSPVAVPLEPSTHYYMTARLPLGDQVFHCQQLPRLHLQPGSAIVRVNALSDLDAELTLRRGSADSAPARAAGREAWSGELALTFHDAAGRPVIVQAGDHLRGQVNGVAVDLEVPPLAADLDRAGRVTGRAAPGTEIRLAMPGPLDGAATRADAEGRFVLPLDPERFPDGLPPWGQELVVYALLPGDHNLERRFAGGSLLLDLGPGVVTGEADPGAALRLTIAGTEVAAAADAGGAFRLEVPTLDRVGAAARIEIGRRRLDLVVPRLSLAYDAASGLADGQGPPETAVELRVLQDPASPGESLSATTDAEGRWSIDLRGGPGRGHRYLAAAPRRLELRWTERQGLVWQRAWERP